MTCDISFQTKVIIPATHVIKQAHILITSNKQYLISLHRAAITSTTKCSHPRANLTLSSPSPDFTPPMTNDDYDDHSVDHIVYLLNEHGVSVPRKDRFRQHVLTEVVDLNLDKTYVEDIWKYDTKFKGSRGSTRKPDGTKAADHDDHNDVAAVGVRQSTGTRPRGKLLIRNVSGAQHRTESFFDTPSTFGFSQTLTAGSSHAQSSLISEELKARILTKREEWAVTHRALENVDTSNALEEQLRELEKEAMVINAEEFQAFKFGSDGYGHKYPKNG